LADERDIYLIEDSAQAPWAYEGKQLAGTVGHIGVFSLNHHKHITTGEGGVCVTNDEELALRLRLLRNHGENAVAELASDGRCDDIVGFNFRLTEPQAALGMAQLKRLKDIVASRASLVDELRAALADLPGVVPAVARVGTTHSFYVFAIRWQENIAGIRRGLFAQALIEEGIPIVEGYQAPLYRLPVVARRVPQAGQITCQVAERLYERELLYLPMCRFDFSMEHMDQIGSAFRKVYAQREKLLAKQGWARAS
jgi:perosamine synthetase